MDVRDDVLWRSLLRGDWALFCNGGRCVKDTSAKTARRRSQLLIAFCSVVAPNHYQSFQSQSYIPRKGRVRFARSDGQVLGGQIRISCNCINHEKVWEGMSCPHAFHKAESAAFGPNLGLHRRCSYY